MPIPKFQFDDPEAGFPRQAVPVRWACMAGNWHPSMFAKFVVGLTDEIGPIVTVYALDTDTKQFGDVHPQDYAQYLTLAQEPLSGALAAIPANHFVWSDELIQSFSDFVDFCLDRETARSTGLHIRWTPDLKNCSPILDQCADFSSLLESASTENRMYLEDVTWTITFGGITKYIKHQTGFRYIHYLLTHPDKAISVKDLELIIEPQNAVTDGVEIAQANRGESDADDGHDGDWQTDEGVDEDDTQEGAYADEESIERRNDKIDNNEGRQFVGEPNRELEASDEESICQYEGQIARNLKQIDVANARGNHVEATKLEMENVKIKKHLASVRNKLKKIRKTNSAHEQRRKKISNAIARARKNVAEVHPACAQHLSTHLHTGSDFYYKPAGAVSWTAKPPAAQ